MNLYGDLPRLSCPVCGEGQDRTRQFWRIPFGYLSTSVIVNNGMTDTAPILVGDNAVCYQYTRCDCCKSIYLDPYNSQTAQEYSTSDRYCKMLRESENWAGYEAQYTAWIHPYLNEKTTAILDAGCGAGCYLRLAHHDPSVPNLKFLIGLELSGPIIAQLAKLYQEPFYFYQLDLTAQNFIGHPKEDPLGVPKDFIILSEVFEHIQFPDIALSNLWGTLTIGGHLFMTAQSTTGGLPIRPAEPIYTSHTGIMMLINSLERSRIVRMEEISGRWKIVMTKQ